MPVPALQRPDPRTARVGRRPQTTAPAAGGGGRNPFVRHSQKARRLAFDKTSVGLNAAFGPEVLKPVGGYLRYLDVLVNASGGSGTAFAVDAPYNLFTNIIVRDPYGEPIVDGDGFMVAYVLQLYGAIPDYATGLQREPTLKPSFVNLVAASGTFQFRFIIPFQLTNDAYCCLPSMNAAAQPTFQANLAAATSVLTNQAGTLVTELRCDEAYFIIPLDVPDLTPPDLGSSHQHHTVTCPQAPAASSNTIVQIPRTGTWLTDIFLVVRDSLNVRQNVFPDPLKLSVDGVGLYDEPLGVRNDVMAGQNLIGLRFAAAAFGAGAGAGGAITAKPTGVIAYTFRDSMSDIVNQDDVGDLYLETTPGTLLELGGSSTWGSAGTGPYTVSAMLGELYPRSGIPYADLRG